MIKNLTIVLFCFAFPAANVLSQSENPGQALEDLVESERSFSRTSEAKGIRAAFLEFLAEDATVFRPKPEPGRPVYEKTPADSPVLLTWTPGYAEVSLAGDLGYTTGPYLLKRNRSDSQPSSRGHYVSVWKKQADGSWKVLLDIGVSHAESGPKVEEVESRRPEIISERAAADSQEETRALIEEDRAFSHLSQEKGALEAYVSYAAEDIRFYREGALPTVGKALLPVALSGISGELTWDPLAAGVSASADLGYTFGLSMLERRPGEDNTAAASSYLRIWRKTAEGKWQAALDIAVPIPQR